MISNFSFCLQEESKIGVIACLQVVVIAAAPIILVRLSVINRESVNSIFLIRAGRLSV